MAWTQQDFANREPTNYMKTKMRKAIYFQARGLSDVEIAKEIGYKNRSSVGLLRQSKWFHQEAKRLEPRLPRPVGKKVVHMEPQDRKQIRELHELGLNNRQIARAMPEWSKRSIDKQIKKMGIKSTCQANLTDEEKAIIIKRREQGDSTRKIAAEIDRSKSCVSGFCQRHFGKQDPMAKCQSALGIYLRKARFTHNLSLKGVVEKLGLHEIYPNAPHKTVSSFERGVRVPSDEVLKLYAERLKLSYQSLCLLKEKY